MGLAASQGRYLCLTARNSDLIYEAQQISQQRLALAKETQAIGEKYNKAMNNTVMQARTAEGGAEQLTYELITSKEPFSGLNMRLVDTNGNVVMPANYLEVVSKNEDGKSFTKKYTSTQDFINHYYPDVTGDKLVSLQGMSLESIGKLYSDENPESGIEITYKNKYNSELVNEDEHVLRDVNCLDPAYLQEMLQSGQWLLQQATPDSEKNGWDEFLWQGSSFISETYYTADDAAAEAEYEAAMADTQKKDKVLELRLEQVQTEQSAVSKEMESVQNIIKKNIEDSFKTFA